MDKSEITTIRNGLGLNQAEFGQLFGVHAMTVSRWESGHTQPSPYQIEMLKAFKVASNARDKKLTADLKQLLVGAGIIAALLFLLKKAGD
jgi:putative transcriptional regulator